MSRTKNQRGFIDITLTHIWIFLIVVGVLGYGVIRAIEWFWPFVKAVIHEATK